jgi:hypothetical protein
MAGDGAQSAHQQVKLMANVNLYTVEFGDPLLFLRWTGLIYNFGARLLDF